MSILRLRPRPARRSYAILPSRQVRGISCLTWCRIPASRAQPVRPIGKASAASWISQSRGAFSVLLVWKFDRLARQIVYAVTAANDLQERHGVQLRSVTEPIDTATPMGGRSLPSSPAWRTKSARSSQSGRSSKGPGTLPRLRRSFAVHRRQSATCPEPGPEMRAFGVGQFCAGSGIHEPQPARSTATHKAAAQFVGSGEICSGRV